MLRLARSTHSPLAVEVAAKMLVLLGDVRRYFDVQPSPSARGRPVVLTVQTATDHGLGRIFPRVERRETERAQNANLPRLVVAYYYVDEITPASAPSFLCPVEPRRARFIIAAVAEGKKAGG